MSRRPRIASALAIALAGVAVWAVGLPPLVYDPIFLASAALALWRPGRGGSPIVAKAAFSLCVFCAALALADVGLRAVLAGSLDRSPHDRLVLRWPRDPRLSRYAPDRVVEMDVVGNLAAMTGDPAHREPRRVRFATGPRGFRNESMPEGQLDLILLGDSFGVGAASSQADTWGSAFSRQWGLATYNLSMPGGPWSQLMNLKHELPGLPVREGTLVLWAWFAGNDLDDEQYASFAIPELPGPVAVLWTRYHTFRNRSPLRRLATRLVDEPRAVLVRTLPDGEPILFLEDYVARARRSRRAVEEHPHWPGLREAMREMRAFAQGHGLKVAVVLVPSKAVVYADVVAGGAPASGARRAASGLSRAVAGLCESDGVPFLDLAPSQIAAAAKRYRDTGELLWWRDDTHWNANGHAAAAASVYRFLVESGLVSGGTGTQRGAD